MQGVRTCAQVQRELRQLLNWGTQAGRPPGRPAWTHAHHGNAGTLSGRQGARVVQGKGKQASLEHLQKLSEEKARSSGGQSGFYFSQVGARKRVAAERLGARCVHAHYCPGAQDIPQQLKAEKQSQQQAQGGQQLQSEPQQQQQGAQKAGEAADGRKHRKELPQTDGVAGVRAGKAAADEQRNPLGFYFDGHRRVEVSSAKEGSESKDPPESPLKCGPPSRRKLLLGAARIWH